MHKACTSDGENYYHATVNHLKAFDVKIVHKYLECDDGCCIMYTLYCLIFVFLAAKSSSEHSVQRPLSPLPHCSKALSHSLARLSLQKEAAHSQSSLHQKNFETLAEDKVQSELAEIITDFKNNIHSISQAEKLVEEWKNRNDVQRSFKEKQAQLNEMRMRYDRVQQEMKNGSKKGSPFDRLRRMFNKGKAREDGPKAAVSAMASSAGLTVALTAASQRPISSLSLQSTSSK